MNINKAALDRHITGNYGADQQDYALAPCRCGDVYEDHDDDEGCLVDGCGCVAFVEADPPERDPDAGRDD